MSRERVGAALLVALLAILGPLAPARAAAATVTKVLVVMEENHSAAEMQAQMPYTWSLAQQYGYATDYTATTHPSLPNYLAIASGSTHGVTDDGWPSVHPLAGPSVFGGALSTGHTAKAYMQSMPATCYLTRSGDYVPKHNPWAYFTDERSGCAAGDVPFATNFAHDAKAGILPTVGMLVPDLAHDAHNGTLATADAWFQARMAQVFAGPDWQSGHLAVVLTADEDDKTAGNHVLTVVIHPSQAGNVVSTPLTHYSLTRLLCDVAQASEVNNAAAAPSMSAAFGLPLP